MNPAERAIAIATIKRRLAFAESFQRKGGNWGPWDSYHEQFKPPSYWREQLAKLEAETEV